MSEVRGGVRAWVEKHAFPIGLGGLVLGLAGVALAVTSLGSGVPLDATDVPPQTEGSTVEPARQGTVAHPATSWIAVKIDNSPQARPQVGIGEAELLVETPVEGGLTRFTALFDPETAPELVGPVRSLRPVDGDLLSPFTAVVAATGGQQSVLRQVRGAGLTAVGPDEAPGWQLLERPAPHNVFLSVGELGAALGPSEKTGLPSSEWPGGEPATEVRIPYGEPVTWTFSEGRYVRGGEGPFEVAATHDGPLEPLAVDTVVVLFAAERSAGYADVNGADVPTFDVIGSGDLLVFSAGEVVEGTWSRPAQSDGFAFATSSGVGFGTPVGTVHLAVVPRELEIGY